MRKLSQEYLDKLEKKWESLKKTIAVTGVELGCCYDRYRNGISFEKWEFLSKQVDYKCVDVADVNGNTISTVWLGIDFGDFRMPSLFETCIFYKNGSSQAEERYYDEEESIIGHDFIVEKFTKKEIERCLVGPEDRGEYEWALANMDKLEDV